LLAVTVLTVVVLLSFAAVAEVVLRCKTKKGVVEKRVKHDAELVDVSRDLLVAQLSHVHLVFSCGAWD
jgi:hypothetical protein